LTPALAISGLTKAYAAPVLRGVSLAVAGGEVRALVGANGAGKSTLCRIVGGLTAADAGEVQLAGRPFRPHSRREAAARGVRMVTQELSLIGALSVAENLLLGEFPARLGWIDRRALREEAGARLRRVGLDALDPARPAATLSVAQQQLVEIASALAGPCRVLILDEPTASLADADAERLFARIAELAAAGTAVVYVSHRLHEVRRIADRVTVLRDGQVAETFEARPVTSAELVRAMAGREAADPLLDRSATPGAAALVVRGLRAGPVRDVSFAAHRGEILGLAGLMGAGRTGTLRAIFGADRREAGEIEVEGTRADIRTPADAVRRGVCLVTEDRKREGLLPSLSVRANLTLARLRALAGPLGLVRGAAERTAAQAQVDALGVCCASLEQPVAQLSGGNQQKVVLGRALARGGAVFLLDEPTRGVDAAARLEIHAALRRLAAGGAAVVVVCSELDELLALSDRVVVLSAGRSVATFARAAFAREAILDAALSGHGARAGGPPA
jgi:ribose transport system ATP-binding protein